VHLEGEAVVLRELQPEQAHALLEILHQPEVACWWGSMPEGFPLEDDPEATRFVIWAEGAVAGMVQFGEEADPDYRHAWVDIFLDPRLHHRGLGLDAATAVVRHLFEDRGHHRLTADPAPDNVPAVRLCEAVGFRRVGLMRACWRDGPGGKWHDALLMELVRPTPA
jgi:aminoglycoside 6'-N-acetyltransferase